MLVSVRDGSGSGLRWVFISVIMLMSVSFVVMGWGGLVWFELVFTSIS